MFISSKLKKYLTENIKYLIKKQEQQEQFNREAFKKINEISKKVKPTEIPDYQDIFKENK